MPFHNSKVSIRVSPCAAAKGQMKLEDVPSLTVIIEPHVLQIAPSSVDDCVDFACKRTHQFWKHRPSFSLKGAEGMIMSVCTDTHNFPVWSPLAHSLIGV